LPEDRSRERTRIQLCGRLSIEVDGGELVGRLRGRQVPLLLTYLVLNRDRALGRDELALALWPDQAPRSQDAALRTLLSRLRSALGGDTVVGRDEVALELPAPVWIDLEAATDQLPRALQALERGDARAAWALAQVPLNIAARGLLPGNQAMWLEPHRRELAETRLAALEVIGRAGLRLGGTQLGSVERAGRSLIETEPYRESGYVLLMEALTAQGNLAEGLRVYERLRLLLREELGTTPSQEALAAHERLLNPGGAASRAEAARADGDGDQVTIELPAALVARGALVGRRDELAALHAWWRGGPERMLVLGGDPGMGKSRLLAELASEVHAEGGVVLAGHAPEETLVPYQPFLEAIGHFAFHAPLARLRAAIRRSGESGPDIARLVSEVRRRLPELPAAESGDPETDRYRLFEAVAGFLGEIAGSGSPNPTLLIVIDDVQWADRPTLLLLRHLIRAREATGLRIAAAYRRGEGGAVGLTATLGALRRDGLARQIDLGGLSRDDAGELVRRRAGAIPSAALQSALYDETDGNPFFIEELVRHLVESGVDPGEAGLSQVRRVGLPDDVRELIARRLERVSPDGLEWLRVAAVIGREFETALLERVLGFDEDRFLAVLEEALDAGLITEAPGATGRYAFSHALVRETLYAGMSSARRARVHHRVGLALEARGGEDAVGALAHHFTQAVSAEDAEKAITYALAAGAQATEMLANEEAAEHYARALEVLERSAPQERAQRCSLLLELGEARVRSGERPAAWPVFREAATIAIELGDTESVIRAALGASRRYIQPPGVIDSELIEMLEHALAMTAGERTVTRVRLLARLCGALYFSPRREEMRQLSAEATAIAAHLADSEAAALAAAARRRAWWGPAHLERRLADSTVLLRAARDAGDLELTLQGHAWLVVDLLEVGDRTAVEAQIEAFAEGADSLRQPLFIWNTLVWRAMLALLEGRLSDADRLASEALASGIRPEGITAPQYHTLQMLAIRREQARIAELETAARELIAGNPGRVAWRAGLAALLCDTGRLDLARAELAALVRVGHDPIPEIPPDGDWIAVVALLAEVASEVGDVERCALLYDLLAPHAEATVVIGIAAVCQGAVARFLGRLALVTDRRELALRHLERAVETNAALGAHVCLAHSQVDLARALGAGDRARSLLAAAEATAAERDLPLVAQRAAVAGAALR
jgi:DNA-binding SARP family transcriptional activator/tetratricopeptide (TPR) repeat protein